MQAMLGKGELPPITDKDSFLSEFNAQFQGIKSWKTPLVTEKTLFRNWGQEALGILGREAVPFFDRGSHLSPGYTGFVRHVVLQNEKADFAYINRGVISFTQKDKSTLSDGILYYETSWKDGDFRVDETYGGFDFSQNDRASLTSRTKAAQYVNERDKLRVAVTQHPNSGIAIRIDEFNEERKKWGWGSVGVIEVRSDPQDPNYQRILTTMQSDPEFFLSSAKIIPLLTGVQISPSSSVHYGFEGGEYGDGYSATTRKIDKNLLFEEALKIAFPTISQQYSGQ